MVDRSLAPEVNEMLEARWEPVYRSQLHYLVTWATRGRRPVLKERHVRRLQDLIAKVCEDRGYGLLEFAAGADHIHALIAMRPSHSVATAVREFKGRSASELMIDHPELRVWLRGNLLWDERYAVETVSAIRLERVRERLRSLHGADEPLARAS